MTWARSKPLDPEEPDVPFTDEDYRRRRPHPNFKDAITLEKNVIKFGKTEKSKLICYVVASGIMYGQGEDVFHYLFKTAWHGQTHFLPIFGEGNNIVPTIHVLDLANIVLHIVDNRPKTKYILATDDSHNTLQEITKAISTELGPGRCKSVPKEEALFKNEVTQSDFDHYQVNLMVEATLAKDMGLVWKADTGLVENIGNIIREYKDIRGLQPVRICILGAPATGKTYFATRICSHFKLHHLTIQGIIKESVDQLQRTAARADVEDNGEDRDETDDAEAQSAQEMLDMLKDDQEHNNSRYSEQYITEFYKKKITSLPCQNQGYVMDGYPKTYEQAKSLFGSDSEGGDEEGDNNSKYIKTMPEVVISLDASDEFLKERVMNLPQKEVEGTHNHESGLTRRLELFRQQNEDDITVLNYFDEQEIHPYHISEFQENVEEDLGPESVKVMEAVKKMIGEPRNYGLTPEEKMEEERKKLEEKLRIEAEERILKERLEQEEREKRQQREAEWEEQLKLVRKEEKEELEAKSLPLRNYLMLHVMPTLTKGLVETCKVKPEDPVDFLAEYLFKNNPQID